MWPVLLVRCFFQTGEEVWYYAMLYDMVGY